jgi:hypothetical protein
MPTSHKFSSTAAAAALHTTPRWAALLLTTVLLAHLMNTLAFSYFAYAQTNISAPTPQAELAAADQQPEDWVPVPTRLGVPRIAIPPDRAEDNRSVAEGNPEP